MKTARVYLPKRKLCESLGSYLESAKNLFRSSATKIPFTKVSGILVPVAGLEPARYRYRWILSYLLHTEYKRTQTPMEVVNGHQKARNY